MQIEKVIRQANASLALKERSIVEILTAYRERESKYAVIDQGGIRQFQLLIVGVESTTGRSSQIFEFLS